MKKTDTACEDGIGVFFLMSTPLLRQPVLNGHSLRMASIAERRIARMAG